MIVEVPKGLAVGLLLNFWQQSFTDIGVFGPNAGVGGTHVIVGPGIREPLLDGSTNYVLHLPPDVTAETFWSITVYEVSTRTLINNKHEIADRSSRMDLAVNADGSVDIYIGPDEPEGTKVKNWIPTESGRAWFPYFRLYSPQQAFLDKTWVLPDIEKAK